ncbi:tape measure protein [Veillonella montpellierensis]|uniref:tape measure protein n=1 Tax=Veillonella montpellierensis TaxID=187328 RepID=UPI0023F7E9B6|nr:tape measure protein [Veillonella montpellierensis]
MREEIKVLINGDSESAKDAITEVGQKAENVFGKRMGSIVSKAFNAIPIAGLVAGVGLVGREVLDLGAKVTAVSDTFTSMKARINIINDGTQTTAEIMDKVYQSAERSRGSYTDMLDSVAKLNMLAKDSFSSNDEAIQFVEQLNKQFKLSGASVTEVSAAMLQLTQAMASGRLQGDEFRSVMENAPMLGQAIAKEMGVSIGELKQLGSEGKITADVIKEALFNSADETNAKFAEMPMTFQEVGQQLSNTMFQAFQPVLEEISSMTASEEFKSVLDGIKISIQVMALVAKGAIASVKGAFNGLVIVGNAVATILKGIFVAPSQAVRTFGVLLVGLTTYLVSVKLATLALGQAYIINTAALKIALITIKAYRLIVTSCSKIMAVFRAQVIAGAVASRAAAVAMATCRTVMLALRGSINLATIAHKAFNLVLKANPIGIVISLLAALATAFIGPKIAAEGFGSTMSAIWHSIVHTVTWAINVIIRGINRLTSALNSISGVISKVLNVDIGKFSAIGEISAEAAENFANASADTIGTVANAFMGGTMDDTSIGGDDGGSGGTGGSGGSGGGGGGDTGSSLQQSVEEAKRAHEQIEDSYRQMFGTKVDEVEAWRKKELEELEKSKAQNANYNNDLNMLNEMYAKKREQALHEEAKRVREIKNSIRDMDVAFMITIATKDSTGSVSPFEKLNQEHAEAMREITDRYQKMSDDFAEMTDRDKQVYIASLQERKIAYEILEDGTLDYSERKRQEELAQLEIFNKKRQELVLNGAETEYAIQEALRTQNFEALQGALSQEYIEHQNAYEMKKELMNQYIESVKEAYFSLDELMNNSLMSGVDSLKNSISGLLQGTTTLTQALQNLGKTMIKSVMDYVAQWAAAQLKQMILGKTLQAQQTATSIAAAQAQLPAWTQLAQQMAMATFGASATAGMAAYTSATAAGQMQSALSGGLFNRDFTGVIGSNKLPKMASGGLAYGRTFAEIGEGRYPEAVVPLSESVFTQIGQGINKANGGSAGDVTIHVSTMDAHSFENWLSSGAGDKIKQFFRDENREFATERGTW